jgi:hypothetical protein
MAQRDLPPSIDSKETSITETTVGSPGKEDMEASKAAAQDGFPREAAAEVNDKQIGTSEEKEQAGDPEEDMEYPHGIKLAIILAALCLSVFLVALDQTIIATVCYLPAEVISDRL